HRHSATWCMPTGFDAPARSEVSSRKVTNRKAVDEQAITINLHKCVRVTDFDTGKRRPADVSFEIYLARTIESRPCEQGFAEIEGWGEVELIALQFGIDSGGAVPGRQKIREAPGQRRAVEFEVQTVDCYFFRGENQVAAKAHWSKIAPLLAPAATLQPC